MSAATAVAGHAQGLSGAAPLFPDLGSSPASRPGLAWPSLLPISGHRSTDQQRLLLAPAIGVPAEQGGRPGTFSPGLPSRNAVADELGVDRLDIGDNQTRAHVVVIEQDIARTTGTRLGDTITVQTASGPASFLVIGISANQQENGTALFVPLTTVHAVLTSMPADANDYWVQTISHDHAFIDRTTTRIEDTLTAHGYDVSSEIVYVRLADEIASNRTLTTTLAVVGLLIVAISMAGLANALTMSVLERTREIGILRSIGARARDIRRMFTAETLTLAAAGWLIGVPLGYLLDLFLIWLVKQALNLNLTLTLAGTVPLALLITLVPIRRAVHHRPGAALRYA
jgi:putative ABC transport system permease protein